MTEEERALLSLSLIPHIGPVIIKQLVHHFGSAQQIFKTPKSKLARIQGIGPKLSNAVHTTVVQNETDRILRESDKHKIVIHFYHSESYPKRLKRVQDSPVVLYSRGNVELNPKKSIGIVGTRKATRYGIKTTNSIVIDAQPSQPTIISGLAFGIDVKSHRAAIESHLPTIAVLACGVDHIYPATHQSTGLKILENGGLLSEYPVGTRADPRYFPARNRILAAMCDALIVVEAASKGGALITANIAHSYDRPVFAVPGELDSTYSEGCNKLIRTMRASIYTKFDDVIQELNWDLAKENRQQELFSQLASLKGMEKRVVEVLMKNNQQMHIDELANQTQYNSAELAHLLLQLEFKGLIRPLPGKEYKVC